MRSATLAVPAALVLLASCAAVPTDGGSRSARPGDRARRVVHIEGAPRADGSHARCLRHAQHAFRRERSRAWRRRCTRVDPIAARAVLERVGGPASRIARHVRAAADGPCAAADRDLERRRHAGRQRSARSRAHARRQWPLRFDVRQCRRRPMRRAGCERRRIGDRSRRRARLRHGARAVSRERRVHRRRGRGAGPARLVALGEGGARARRRCRGDDHERHRRQRARRKRSPRRELSCACSPRAFRLRRS